MNKVVVFSLLYIVLLSSPVFGQSITSKGYPYFCQKQMQDRLAGCGKFYEGSAVGEDLDEFHGCLNAAKAAYDNCISSFFKLVKIKYPFCEAGRAIAACPVDNRVFVLNKEQRCWEFQLCNENNKIERLPNRGD